MRGGVARGKLRGRVLRALGHLAVIAPLLLACRDSHTPPRSLNLVLVTLDTTRADFCSLYGYEAPTTPVLDALGRRGWIFDTAIAPSTWTLPVHASLFTGVYPSIHGVVSSLSPEGEFGRPLPADRITLPELLQQQGYQTAGFVGGPFLTRGFGFQRGFDAYDARLGDYGVRAGTVNDRVRSWLETERDTRPLFLFVNYYDPHRPYDPPADLEDPLRDPTRCRDAQPRDFDPASSGTLPDPVDVACARMQYAREIRGMDRALGELLTMLESHRELDDALLAVVGDHGESFGENDAWAHGGPGFLHQRHVPLVIVRSGSRPTPATRVEPPTSIVRLPGTLLQELGVAPPPGWLGPSLLSAQPAALPPLTERYTRERTYYALSYPRFTYMLIQRPDGELQRQLFRIDEDRSEHFVNATQSDPEVVEQAERAWHALRQELGPLRRFSERTQPPPDLPQQLRSLGYLR
jgi:arylsulfatase A-like enzyme